MNLQSCPNCGLVVDFDKMKPIESSEMRDKVSKEKLIGYFLDGQYEKGFFCIGCKEFVYTYVD